MESNGQTAVAPRGEVSVAQQKMDGVRSLLEKMRGNMAAVLPKHLTPERMIKVALVSCVKTPKLLDCDPKSLVAAMMQASELGLDPGGALGHGYLVPFKNQVQFIPGYKGLIQLARNSGDVTQIGAWPVFKGEVFEYSNTDQGQKLNHIPKWDGPRKPDDLTHVYMVARLKDTDLPQIEVMTRGDVDAIRARSKAANDGPWVTDYVEMARKSVVKRGVKYLPISSEKFQQAIELDNRVLGNEYDLLPEEELRMPTRESDAGNGESVVDPAELDETPGDLVLSIKKARGGVGADDRPWSEYLAKTKAGGEYITRDPKMALAVEGFFRAGSRVVISSDGSTTPPTITKIEAAA